jgi:hypothetical protein
MQKILPQARIAKTPPKNLWQDWAWKIGDRDGNKTIALIQKNVKKQIQDSLKKTKKKRKVKYEWQFRVKVSITPPAMRAPGISGTTDPPAPKQPPPPSM